MKVESGFANINKTLAGHFSPSKSSQLVIDEGLKSQSKGYQVATDNIETAINVTKVADGALASITDSLQSIRELAIKASNGTLNDANRSAIQNQIDEYKQSIQDVASSTNFNTKKLLDGSFDASIQTGPNSGQGEIMKIADSSLASLGIENFDVTGNFNIEDIDNALEKVTASRSQIGATGNRFEFSAKINNIASENLESARSLLQEDIARQISQLNTNRILDQFKLQMQQKQSQEKGSFLTLMG